MEAPSSLGLRSTGVRKLPEALLEAGLARDLGGARLAGRVAPRPHPPESIDAGTGVLHGRALVGYTQALARAVVVALDRGETPLVLGGDCSVLLGGLLALRGRGRHGLFYADGHADFYDPATEPEGEAASMALALATGRGPAPLADLDGLGALVEDGDVVAVGFRDHEEQRQYRTAPLPEAVLALDLPAVRERGVGWIAEETLDRLVRPELDGFWLHVDADVLDDAIMPAVDYRLPDGLDWDELTALLRAAVATGRVRGVDVTILNPGRDPTGEAVRGLARCLADGLRP